MARVTPFYRSLIEPRLTLGVDNNLLGLIGIGSVGLLIAFRSWWPLVAGIAALVVMRSIFSADPLYLSVYARYCSEGDHYEPWTTASGRSGRRRGRGRGLLC